MPFVAKTVLVMLIGTAILWSPAVAAAQFDDKPAASDDSEQSTGGAQPEAEQTVRIQVGIIIKSTGSVLRGVYGTTPIPIEWPEQKVKIVEEDISRQVKSVKYKTVGKTMKQMVVTIPTVERGGTAKALVTFEVKKSALKAPEETDGYVIPEKLDRKMRKYLMASPYIETRNGRIRKLAKQLDERTADLTAWKKVETIYDWVRDNIEYKKGDLKGAQRALKDGYGDCEELSSLFIAICRINDIPARTVWIPGHCYPEFYLHDSEGNGYWFPCQAAGARAFGSMPEHRIILQKGDNFKVPEKKERQRYVAEFLKVDSAGAKKPKVEFVRKVLP